MKAVLESYALAPVASLTCMFGTPWAEHFIGPLFACAACAAETARLIAANRRTP